MAEPGDKLHYVYDYGDSWEHALQLEQVLPADADTPLATCVGGRRRAPEEDSGGLWTAEEQGALPGGDDFAIEDVNRALAAALVLHGHGLHPDLTELARRLARGAAGTDLTSRLARLVDQPVELSDDEAGTALRAHQWFLDLALADGIELTAAGYLKPAAVAAAMQEVPSMRHWIHSATRESDVWPLLQFRETLTTTGLLRKSKGRLVLTKAGAAARRGPAVLWGHLADRIVPSAPGSFDRVATLLYLA